MYSETFRQVHSWTSALYIHYTQINTEDKEAGGKSSHSTLTIAYMDFLLCITGVRTNSCFIMRSKWPREIILPMELRSYHLQGLEREFSWYSTCLACIREAIGSIPSTVEDGTDVVIQACDPSTRELQTEGSVFKAFLGYIASSNPP